MTDLDQELLFDEEGAQGPRRPGAPVDLRRLLPPIREAWRPLLGVLCGGLLVALALAFLLPSTFRSTGQLLYDGVAVLEQDEASYRDPAALIESAALPDSLREVRESLQWVVTLRALEERVGVRVSPDGQAMVVSGDGASPQEAQTLVRAVMDTFLARQRRLTARRVEAAAEQTASALQGARERKRDIEQRYEAFQTRTGERDPVAEHTRLVERAQTLLAKADEQGVERAAQEARVAELTAAKAAVPATIVASETNEAVVARPLAQAQADLAAARAHLSERHPRVQALKDRVQRLREQQRQGTGGKVSNRVSTANPTRGAVVHALANARAAMAAAERRELSFRELAAKAKADADALAAIQVEGRGLERELELANVHQEELLAREVALRDLAASPASGFRVLAEASLPERPLGVGFRWAAVVLAPLLFVLIGVLVVVARELNGLRVQTAREVAWWGNGPVLGTTAWPRVTGVLDEFVDEFEDFGLLAGGQTLVVPASERERDLACEFAARLGDAPWLAAAILDVQESVPAPVSRAGDALPLLPSSPGNAPPPPDEVASEGADPPPDARRWSRPPSTKKTLMRFVPPTIDTPASMVPPPPSTSKTLISFVPPAGAAKRSSSPPQTFQRRSSRPPRKPTVAGMPPARPPLHKLQVGIDEDASAIPLRRSSAAPPAMSSQSASAFSAAVRMVVSDGAHDESRPILLTKPVIVGESRGQDVEPSSAPRADAETGREAQVMRAVERVLRIPSAQESAPPRAARDRAPVALAWNGPLSGPVLRRAARLSDRVIVIVSAGTHGMTLSRQPVRLGRSEGVGFVLVNAEARYAELEDRVGPVEAFWNDSVQQSARA